MFSQGHWSSQKAKKQRKTRTKIFNLTKIEDVVFLCAWQPERDNEIENDERKKQEKTNKKKLKGCIIIYIMYIILCTLLYYCIYYILYYIYDMIYYTDIYFTEMTNY